MLARPWCRRREAEAEAALAHEELRGSQAERAAAQAELNAEAARVAEARADAGARRRELEELRVTCGAKQQMIGAAQDSWSGAAASCATRAVPPAAAAAVASSTLTSSLKSKLRAGRLSFRKAVGEVRFQCACSRPACATAYARPIGRSSGAPYHISCHVDPASQRGHSMPAGPLENKKSVDCRCHSAPRRAASVPVFSQAYATGSKQVSCLCNEE